MNVAMVQDKVRRLTAQLEATKTELQAVQGQCNHVWGENRQITTVNDAYTIPAIGFGPFLRRKCEVPAAKVTYWEVECVICGYTKKTHITTHNQGIAEPSASGDILMELSRHFGQPNLTAMQKSYAIGKVYHSSKRKNGGDRRSKDAKKEEVGEDTGSIIAKRFHSSTSAVKRHAKLSVIVDEMVSKHGQDVFDLLLAPSGKITIDKKSVFQLHALPSKYQSLVINQMRQFATGIGNQRKTKLASLVEIQEKIISVLGENGQPVFV